MQKKQILGLNPNGPTPTAPPLVDNFYLSVTERGRFDSHRFRTRYAKKISQTHKTGTSRFDYLRFCLALSLRAIGLIRRAKASPAADDTQLPSVGL
jgi:hypothetical protein